MGEAKKRREAIETRVRDMLREAGNVDADDPAFIQRLVQEEIEGAAMSGARMCEERNVPFFLGSLDDLADKVDAGAFVNFNIGGRNDLSEEAAQKAAES